MEPPLTARRIPYKRHVVETPDGVSLAVQSVGRGPTILIGNGIGVTSPGLDILVDHLRSRHRVITWDYRGIGASRLPGRDVDLSVRRHAADAVQILDALGERRAAVLGWSLGVQVGLETIRSAPERVVAFGALFGAAGQPFRAAFHGPGSELVHVLVHLACELPQPAQALLLLGSRFPPLARWICTMIGFCSEATDRAAFEHHVRSTAGADKWAYFVTMREMMEHDARDLLPSVECPVLVVAGEDDWVTPPAAARIIARGVRGARLIVLPRTSHFGPIEHGPALWEPIEKLLLDAGWTATPRKRRPSRRSRPGVAAAPALGNKNLGWPY